MKNLLVSKLSLNKFFKTIFTEHTEFLGDIVESVIALKARSAWTPLGSVDESRFRQRIYTHDHFRYTLLVSSKK